MNETSFFLFYGRDPTMPQGTMIPLIGRFQRQITAQNLDICKTRLIQVLRSAHQALDKHKHEYQNKYKQYYDKTKKPIYFAIGEKFRIYFPIAEEERLKYKLGTRWRGPYTLVNKIDDVHIELKMKIVPGL